MSRRFFVAVAVGLLFGLVPAGAIAKVFLEASPTTLPLNHLLRVKVTLENQKGTIRFEATNLRQLQSSRQYKTSIEIINAKVTRKTTYEYEFSPLAEGSALLKVFVEGKEEGQVSVQVVAASQVQQSSPSTSPRRQPNNPFGFGRKNRRSVGPEDVIITNLISKSRAVVGEVLVLTTIMYYKPGIESPRLLESDQLTGFTLDEVPKSTYAHELPSKTINNQTYKGYVLKEHLLYAHYAGSHELIGGLYSVGQSSFFFTFSDRVKIRANNLQIRVDSAPEFMQPKTFENAVGDFSLTANKLPDETPNQEAFLWRITIAGKGNFKTLIMPKPVIGSPSVILKQSQVKDDFRVGASNYEGSKIVEYYLLPQESKPIQVPDLVFSFFSPAQKTYVTKRIKGKTIRVRASGAVAAAKKPPVDQVKLSAEKHLFPIVKGPLKADRGRNFFSSPSFLIPHLAVIFLVLLFPAAKLRRVFVASNDGEFVKPFRRQLLDLKSLEGSPFLNQIQDLLFQYLRRRYGLERAVSTYDMTKALEQQQAPKEALALLERINSYQKNLFSPAQKPFDPKAEVQDCLGLMEQIERHSRVSSSRRSEVR